MIELISVNAVHISYAEEEYLLSLVNNPWSGH